MSSLLLNSFVSLVVPIYLVPDQLVPAGGAEAVPRRLQQLVQVVQEAEGGDHEAAVLGLGETTPEHRDGILHLAQYSTVQQATGVQCRTIQYSSVQYSTLHLVVVLHGGGEGLHQVVNVATRDVLTEPPLESSQAHRVISVLCNTIYKDFFYY